MSLLCIHLWAYSFVETRAACGIFARHFAYDINSRSKPHLNIGTIGHVDHGKTTLTAAITKVNTCSPHALPADCVLIHFMESGCRCFQRRGCHKLWPMTKLTRFVAFNAAPMLMYECC